MKPEIPPSLSQNVFLNTGVQSQSMPILEASQILPNSVPTVPSLVIDGPSFFIVFLKEYETDLIMQPSWTFALIRL